MSVAFEKITGMADAARCHGISAAFDLSDHPRAGCRGPNVQARLQALGYNVPGRANTAHVQRSGELLARLSATEFLLLGHRGAAGQTFSSFSGDSLLDAERFYRLERFETHAWFVLTGARCAELMAKLCGVDLRIEAAPAGSVIQTSVARINAIVIRQPVHGVDSLNLLVDRSFRTYVGEVLRDAMNEFGGQFIDASLFGELQELLT